LTQGDDEEDPDGDELNVEGDDLELRLARLQYLLDRRPVPDTPSSVESLDKESSVESLYTESRPVPDTHLQGYLNYK
jgi:hypothetical protein